ncbi:MAG: hypothetical protein KDA85_06285 [Planctomycetaceae bacterium]|nr:hypothetical protein [Planctomycetaceae bacterium]
MYPMPPARAVRRIRAVALTIAAVLTTMTVSTVVAEDGSPVVRVEEDWVALIRTPDRETSAPQIVNVIAPTPSTSAAFGILELNHNSVPRFREGGIQIQAWNSTQNIEARTSEKTARLYNVNDRLEYTVTIAVTPEGYQFGVVNGRSRSWGDFCRNPLTVAAPAEAPTLENYRPEWSVANTNVNVGAHRVEILYLRSVRYFHADGTSRTDDTMRVIHRFQDLVQDVSLEEYDQNASFYNIEITETGG